MIEIKPSLNKADIAACCRKCGKTPSEAFYLYTAADNGKTLAAGLFEMQSDRVAAVYYESAMPDDYFLFDGVLRAALNYASGQGVETGHIPEAFRQAHDACFSKLNYPPETQWNIVNFFGKYKGCRG